jgi:hypothetical protein
MLPNITWYISKPEIIQGTYFAAVLEVGWFVVKITFIIHIT